MLVLSATPAHRRLRETAGGARRVRGSTSLGESLENIRFRRVELFVGESLGEHARQRFDSGDPQVVHFADDTSGDRFAPGFAASQTVRLA
jgi:hypothetical protein